MTIRNWIYDSFIAVGLHLIMFSIVPIIFANFCGLASSPPDKLPSNYIPSALGDCLSKTQSIRALYSQNLAALYFLSLLAVLTVVTFFDVRGIREFVSTMVGRIRTYKELVAGLSLIFCIAAVVRLFGLGLQSFWNDESTLGLQVKALLRFGFPIMPTDLVQDRGISYDVLAAVLLNITKPASLADTDIVLRVPAAIFGLFTVILALEFGRRLDGFWTGLGAAAFLAIGWWEVAWSRQASFYTQFQFFYLVSVFVFYLMVFEKRRGAREIVSFVIAIILLWLSNYPLAPLIVLSLLLPATGYVVFRSRGGQRRILCLTILIVVVATFFVIQYRNAVILRWIAGELTQGRISSAPLAYNTFYSDFLYNTFPLAIVLGVLGVTRMFVVNRIKALFLASQIVIPFLQLSVLLSSFYLIHPFERYSLVLMPFFGIACAAVLPAIFRVIPRFTSRPGLQKPRVVVFVAVFLLTFAVTASAAGPVSANPSNWSLLKFEPQPDYRDATLFVAAHLTNSDVIAAQWPENTYYYLGSTSYWVTSWAPGAQLYGIHTSGAIYYYLTNSTLVQNGATLYSVIKTHPTGWLIITASDFPGYNSDLHNFITSNMVLHPGIWSSTLLVYSWNFTKTSSANHG